jgi:hypothetical protein
MVVAESLLGPYVTISPKEHDLSVAAIDREVDGQPAPSRPQRVGRTVDSTIDVVVDGIVLAFASWTILYHVGLIFGIHTNPLLAVWALSLPLVPWLLIRTRDVPPKRDGGGSVPMRTLLVPAVGLALVSAVLIAFGHSWRWWLGWTLAAAAALIGLVAALRSAAPREARQTVDVPPGQPIGTVVALGSAAVLSFISLFAVHIGLDDAFYVDRAAWTADHGTIATRDTLFSSQTLPAVHGAGVPVASFETLQGAVAHVLHLAGGTVVYLFTPPVGVFVAVWALWRLIRRWAPRRQVLCFVIGHVYLLWACHTLAQLGLFFLPRIQQGKIILVCALLPLLWVHLTNWASRPNRRTALVLAGGGIAAIGLTSTATFLMPLIAAAVVLPLALRREYPKALGATLPAVYPVLVGLVVHFTHQNIDSPGAPPSPQAAVQSVLGTRWFFLIGWVAVLCLVWLVRGPAARLVTAGIAGVLVVVLGPGVLSVMNVLTGAHAVLYRTMWVAPVPAAVGLLAAVPVPARAKWASAVPAAAIAAAVVVAGAPFWNVVSFQPRPSWRYYPIELRRANQILAQHPHGTVLAPLDTMFALSLKTTKIHSLAPRRFYMHALVEPADKSKARRILVNVIDGYYQQTQPTTLRKSLDLLDVALVCGLNRQRHERQMFGAAGYLPTTGVSGGWCLRSPSSSEPGQ